MHQKLTTRFFFISNSLKLAKNQARTKQHPGAELLLFFAFFIYVIIQKYKEIF